ncbi:hypothetical protein JD844_026238, partial [Phrynosoma platyrhinos]
MRNSQLLFKEVVGILDPEMLLVSEEADTGFVEQEHQTSSTVKSGLENKRTRQTKFKFTNQVPLEVEAREREAKLNYVPPLSENVKRATRDLCSWLQSLGGEKYNIDEATVISLFDGVYETRLPTSSPINVVELKDLPVELQTYVGRSSLQAAMKRTAHPGSHSKEFCQPKWEKIRFGAWYLDPKTWTKQKGNEPLADPKSKDASIQNARKTLDGKM